MTRGEWIDVEQIHQIESGIANSLANVGTVDVDKGTIENGYCLLDATQGEVTGTLHEKCAMIIDVLKDEYFVDASYTVQDGTIRFVPNQPR